MGIERYIEKRMTWSMARRPCSVLNLGCHACLVCTIEIQCYCILIKSMVGSLNQQAIRMLCWLFVWWRQMCSSTGVNYLLCDPKFTRACKHTGDISQGGSFPDVAPLEYISGWSVCVLIKLYGCQTAKTCPHNCECKCFT